jgi:hypothetical protein
MKDAFGTILFLLAVAVITVMLVGGWHHSPDPQCPSDLYDRGGLCVK